MSADNERHRAALLTALARVAVVALIFLGERLRLEQPEGPFDHLAFDLTLAAAAGYALAVLAMVVRGSPAGPSGRSVAILDLAFLGALTYASAGELATVRRAYFLVPVLAAFTQPSRTSAQLALATPVVFCAAALLEGGGEEAIGVTAAFLLLVGGASVAIAKLLEDRSARITGLIEESRALTARALEAEDGERRRLAFAIHDEPVQQLLAARLELDRVRHGDRDAATAADRAVRDALGALRQLTFELHPHALEQIGLFAAVEQIADAIADRTGAEIDLEIDEPDSGARRDLCFAIVRELLRNAEKHAQARRVDVSVRQRNGMIRIAVRDDGVGIPSGRAAEATGEGHIGLVAVIERAHAVGGRADIESTPGRGTTVEVTLPAS